MNLRLLPYLVGLLLVATSLIASPAYAEKLERRDPKRDVISWIDDVDQQSHTPGIRSADLTKVLIRHGKQRVKVRVRVVNLRSNGDTFLSMHLWTDTSVYGISVHTGLGTSEIRITDKRGNDLACDKARFRYDTERDVVRFAVPRSCLGDPKWFRPDLSLIRDGIGTVATADDALRRGIRKDDRPKVGPKLRTG